MQNVSKDCIVKQAQKPDHASLNQLLSWLRDGRYVIPNFQREFEWAPWDIRDLVRSIFLDYYIGSLLLWKGKPENIEALSCQPIYGFDGKGHPENIVLDGQQRLTAMYYAFVAPTVKLPNRSSQAIYWVNPQKLIDGEHDAAFDYWFMSRDLGKLLEDRERQYEGHFFPCSLIGSEGWDLPNWVQGYEQYWRTKADKAQAAGDPNGAAEAEKYAGIASEFGAYIKELTEQYQVSYIELDRDLDLDRVCDIFTKLNSKGVRLDVFDLMNALLTPKGLELKQLYRDAQPRLRFVESDKLNVYLLQVMSILKQDYCSPKYLYYLIPGAKKTTRTEDGKTHQIHLFNTSEEFQAGWDGAVGAMERTVDVLRHPQEYGAIAPRFLPYASILPVFAALSTTVNALPPDMKLRARGKVRRWYWASVFDNRYSRSVESTSASDFRDLKAWFASDDKQPGWLEGFPDRLKSLDLVNQFNTGSSVYKGVFNTMITQGARDWVTGEVPDHKRIDDHHIVPRSWGNTHLPGRLVHSVLNRTPLTPETNKNVIRDRLPNDYLKELIEKNGRDAVEFILQTHLISSTALDILLRDPFTPNDFEEFITERRITIIDAISALTFGGQPELSPAMQEMKAEVSRVEIGLRHLIADRLNHDKEQLPSHCALAIQQRIDGVVSKDPTFDPSSIDSLEALLEYADLRELQQILLAKSSWVLFQPVFKSKPELEARFSYLAELRNAFAHNRSVSIGKRKDGDAAIDWFKSVLRNDAGSAFS